MPRPQVRPLEPRDIDAVHHVTASAFDDLARRFGDPPEPPGSIASARVRIGRLLATDPGGAWVAERHGEVVGCSLALIRDGDWGLSLLVVAPPTRDDIAALLDRALPDAGLELRMEHRRGVPGRGRRPVRALSAKWGLPLTPPITFLQWPQNHAR